VVVIPDRRAPVVTHMVWYKVGSADDEPGQSGVAHFLEHLMFKGTEKYPAGEFSARIAEIGGEENAFTSHDYTAYFQQVAPSALPMVMELESDRMRGLILTDEVIGPERDVVIEERRMRVDNDPGAVLSEELDATLYQHHPYGIPVIGWMHEIETLDRSDAVSFYNRYYAPNNAVLVVAGDIDAEQVKTLAEETYGKVETGPALPPRVRPQEPQHDTSRTVTLSDPRVSVPSLQKSWVVPSYENASEGEAEALDLLAEILGGGIRSRLYQELIVRQGIASSAGAFYQGSSLDPSSFGVYGSPRGDATLEQVEAAIAVEVERVLEEGVTEAELERARNRFVRGLIFARDDQSGMARTYGVVLSTGGTVEDIAEWPERIGKVTVDDIREAARDVIEGRSSVTGYLRPAEGSATPAEPPAASPAIPADEFGADGADEIEPEDRS
jgi:zinc protease